MIYIDLLVIQDLIYNYVILLGTSILLTRKTNFKKIFLSSIIGAFSLILLFLNINKILILIISFIFSFIMSITAYAYKNMLYTIKNVFYMYIISIFIGGFIFLIKTNFIVKIDNTLLNIIILILLSPIITYIYIKSVNTIKYNYSNYYKVDIYINNEDKITTTAFLDTGNKLIDPYKQRPIILINKSLININNHKVLLVPYNTVNNNDLLRCITLPKIHIHNIGYRTNFLIGLIDDINIDGVECILNSKLLERI